MHIQSCTLTGADDATPLDRIVKLHQCFPIAEFGILLGSVSGLPRYPSPKWIEAFVNRYRGPKSIHLCSNQVAAFLDGDSHVIALTKSFNRIQLNFSLAKMPELVPKLRTVSALLQNGQSCIVQVNAANEALSPTVPGTQAFHCLFDGSAGNGITPESWPSPLAGRFCGYAGGLNPFNLADQLDRIRRIVTESKTHKRVWIDLETGLRDESNRFSFEKAQQVLTVVNKFNRQNAKI